MWLCDYELFTGVQLDVCLIMSVRFIYEDMNIHRIDSFKELNDASFNLIIMLVKM